MQKNDFFIPKFAINFLKEEEGCKLEAYKDGMGQWTIGYGTSFYPLECEIENKWKKRKVKINEAVKEGDKIDIISAEKFLISYLQHFCLQDIKDITSAVGTECVVNGEKKKKLSDEQVASILSVSYNVCRPKFSQSKCKQYIIKRMQRDACREWNWGVKNTKNPGLKIRRNKEIELFYGIHNFWS